MTTDGDLHNYFGLSLIHGRLLGITWRGARPTTCLRAAILVLVLYFNINELYERIRVALTRDPSHHIAALLDSPDVRSILAYDYCLNSESVGVSIAILNLTFTEVREQEHALKWPGLALMHERLKAMLDGGFRNLHMKQVLHLWVSAQTFMCDLFSLNHPVCLHLGQQILSRTDIGRLRLQNLSLEGVRDDKLGCDRD